MPMEKIDTIIIGGGLSGIYAAFLMAEKKNPLFCLRPDLAWGAAFYVRSTRAFLPTWGHPGIGP